MEKEYDVTKAAAAQKKYCCENEAPHFAPSDGTCYACDENIYRKLHGYSVRLKGGRYRFKQTSVDSGEGRFSGISVEKAGSELVTGCPHCSRSYCD